MWYVTMLDSFMSGWGHAEGKKNRLVFLCDFYEEAEIVFANAKERGDMKYVRIVSNEPKYSEKTHYTQYKTKEDYPSWYVRDYFRKRKS